MKLVYKRVIIVVTIFIIAFTVSSYLIYQTYSDLNEELVKRTSLLLGRAVEEALTNAADKNLEELTGREKKRIRALMSSMTTETGSIIHILLINDKMKILLSSDKSIEGHEYKSAEELANLHSEEPQVLRKVWDDKFDVLDVIIPLKNQEGYVFSYLRLVISRRELLNFYEDLSFIFLPITVIFSILIAFTFYFISRTYKHPVESIKKLASRLNDGDYSYRINYSRKDEFTDTFDRLNKTIEKVGVMDESYKKAEKRISSLLQAVDESIILIDNEGGLSSYNEASSKMFHCPGKKEFADFFKEILSLNNELLTIISNALSNEQITENKELTIWLPDGGDILTRVSSQIYKEEDRVNGVLLTFKDLHLLNELQRNLQRSMKFGVIAGLASSISHEIKNPLSAMAIHAEILNNRIKKIQLSDKEKVHKSLDILQNEVKRLNRIISQFLSLARVKQTDLNLIDINSLIKDVLVLVQQQAIERNIQIESELDESLDYIYGDADQLKQVILNIVLNGFQAIDHSGTVFIRTRGKQRRIFVEIHDTGKGMPPDVQKRIFDLYFSTKEDGGGIGLAVSKNIMQAHDGRISFESVVGKGTVFTLDFLRKEKTTQLNIPVLKN
jgi:signal transduction histidine kinase/HAMP domain-containing protein